jgi:hypothetical protein
LSFDGMPRSLHRERPTLPHWGATKCFAPGRLSQSGRRWNRGIGAAHESATGPICRRALPQVVTYRRSCRLNVIWPCRSRCRPTVLASDQSALYPLARPQSVGRAGLEGSDTLRITHRHLENPPRRGTAPIPAATARGQTPGTGKDVKGSDASACSHPRPARNQRLRLDGASGT